MTCPECGGGGEITVCANDGSHGCSHINDREYRCPLCDGDGSIPDDPGEAS